MSNITVCARFRPLSSRERTENGGITRIQILDDESFYFKDEKEEDIMFNFDRVFHEESDQRDVYEILASPVVRDAVDAINGTIISYGQTGAGKTYSMEGPRLLSCDHNQKGLLPRAVEGLFDGINASEMPEKFTVKLSMVEIYMERVRDLYDLSKDNIQIKESKAQGILLSGVTEVTIVDPAEALKNLARGVSNRAVGETQMNSSSSRSHCIYMFTIQKELGSDQRVKTGKLILVDLAGSEKADKTRAEGRLLDEAKTINKSLSALGNVINALTSTPQGKANHIPYRDSKLTRILQDSLGGYSRTALLCCCSPCPSNALETLSTLRFGARAKHIKAPLRIVDMKKQDDPVDESRPRILKKLGEKLDGEEMKLIEELFIIEGLFFDPNCVEDVEDAYVDVTSRTIHSLQSAVEELMSTVKELKRENKGLKAKLKVAEAWDKCRMKEAENQSFLHSLFHIFRTT